MKLWMNLHMLFIEVDAAKALVAVGTDSGQG